MMNYNHVFFIMWGGNDVNQSHPDFYIKALRT